MKESDIDVVKRYIDGQMNAQEARDFEERLQSDPEFARAVKMDRELLESMHIFYKSKLKQRLQKEDKKARPISGSRPSKDRWWMAAASLALIAVAVYFLVRTDVDSQDLYEQYHTTYYNVAEEGLRSDGSQEIDQAFRAYDQGDFAEAAVSLGRLVNQDPQNLTYQFYLGLSFLEIGESRLAQNALDKVANAHGNALAEPGKWYLALAYIKSNDLVKARSILKAIADTNSAYANRAEDLLNEW